MVDFVEYPRTVGLHMVRRHEFGYVSGLLEVQCTPHLTREKRMQKQEIKEKLPLWAIAVAHGAGINLQDVTLDKLTPKTVTFTLGDWSQTLYQRNAWK